MIEQDMKKTQTMEQDTKKNQFFGSMLVFCIAIINGSSALYIHGVKNPIWFNIGIHIGINAIVNLSGMIMTNRMQGIDFIPPRDRFLS
jgi:hypothetical protein